MTESDQNQRIRVLDNSSKFTNHQRTLNWELFSSSYDQNNMTVKPASKTLEKYVENPNPNQPKH